MYMRECLVFVSLIDFTRDTKKQRTKRAVIIVNPKHGDFFYTSRGNWRLKVKK